MPAEPKQKFATLARWLRTVATHDVFPTFSARVRRALYNPLGILILAAIAALLCGLVLHVQGLALFGGIVSVIGLGIVWPWLTVRAVTATLAFDRPRVTEGETVGVELILHNRLWLPAWGLAVRGGLTTDDHEVVAAISSAPARRKAVCRWLFKPACRGLYPRLAPRLTSGFPFGLWNPGRALTVEAPLIVWPKTFPVGPIPPLSGDHQIEGNVSRNKVGSMGDVLGVRPYRRGDSPRRIHWGQSAKHDRLIVCELQSNARPIIQLILDADPHIHRGAGAESSWEWALRIVASLAQGWLAAGAQVGLVWSGGAILPASGRLQLLRILDTLAGLAPTGHQPLGELLQCPSCHQFRDGLQVIVTTDRGHTHPACRTCLVEHQRWVILISHGFAADETLVPGCPLCVEPWLRIDNPHEIPTKLRSGWREARHGS